MIDKVYHTLSKRESDDLMEPLKAAMALYDISGKSRVCHFLSQLAHESDGFTRLVENLNYSADGMSRVWPSRFMDKATRKPNELALRLHRKPEMIANAVYADRMGNGSRESGDGFKYRGRGLIQLTGKTNYKRASQAIFNDLSLVANPDLVAQDLSVAAQTATWFWNDNNLSPLADADSVLAVTRRINGGTTGLAHRTDLLNEAKGVWGDDDEA